MCVVVGATKYVGIIMHNIIILAQTQHVQHITNNRTLCYVVVVAWSRHMSYAIIAVAGHN
jgi:hypothetical protein